MRTSRSTTRAIAALAAVALASALAACGSKDGGSGSDSGTLKFGLISGNGPGTPGADLSVIPSEKAAIDAINAAGGVNGRKIELEFCDTAGDPNKAGACAAKFAGDKSILATIGNINYSGTNQINPTLQRAGIPAIATFFIAISDMDVSNIYPVEAGVLAGLEGTHQLLAAAGAKRMITVTLQSPEVAPNLDFIKKKILPQYPGAELLDPQLLAPTTTDLTAMGAATLAQHPDAIFVGLGPNTVPFIQLLRSQGFKGMIGATASAITPAQIKTLGSDGDGILEGSGQASSGPGWDKYQAELSKYQPDAVPNVSGEGINAWIGVHLFADVLAKTTGDITRKSLTDALNALSDYSTGGLTPPVDYTKPNPAPGFSREFNPYVLGRKVSDGAAADTTPVEFMNLFTGAKVSPTS